VNSQLFRLKNHKPQILNPKINKKMKMGKERKKETGKETRIRIKEAHEIFKQCDYTLLFYVFN